MDTFPLPGGDSLLCYYDLPGDPSEAGDRAPLVWLHCLGGAAVAYARAARQLPLAARRAILVDLPGFGCSPHAEHFGYALEDHARAVAALLDGLNVRDVVLVGHSMGGSVAITLAALRPELVGRLIVAEPPLELAEGSASRRFVAQTEAAFVAEGYASFLAPLRAAGARGDRTASAFAAQFAIADPRAIHRTARGMVAATPGLRARLLALPVPRAYLWGAWTLRDEPRAAALAAGLAAPGLTVRVVPDAGHLMNLDNSEGFAAVVTGVLGA